MYQHHNGPLTLRIFYALCLAAYVSADGFDYNNNPAYNLMQIPVEMAGGGSVQYIMDDVNNYVDMSQEIPQGYDYQPFRSVAAAAAGSGPVVGLGGSNSGGDGGGRAAAAGAATLINSNSHNNAAAAPLQSPSMRGEMSANYHRAAAAAGVAATAAAFNNVNRHNGGSISLQSPIVRGEMPANYEYSYGIHDESSGDIKSHSESRVGDLVRGVYSLIDADGYRRTVTYTVDGDSGFNAIVDRQPIPGQVQYVQQQQQQQQLLQQQQQEQQQIQQATATALLQQVSSSVARAKEQQQHFAGQAATAGVAYDPYAAIPQQSSGPYS